MEADVVRFYTDLDRTLWANKKKLCVLGPRDNWRRKTKFKVRVLCYKQIDGRWQLDKIHDYNLKNNTIKTTEIDHGKTSIPSLPISET